MVGQRAKEPESARQMLINRREAILRVSAMLGGTALVGQAAMLAGCAQEEHDAAAAAEPAHAAPVTGSFTAEDIAYLDEVADTILPETDTPGAKAAGVGAFMALMVTDIYAPGDQQVFRNGMQTLDERCLEANGKDFRSATPSERLSLLEALDQEQYDHMQVRGDGEPAHWFRMMKELTLVGYFTSELGCTEALRYVETPGRFDPCAPLEAGDTVWAQHGAETSSRL